MSEISETRGRPIVSGTLPALGLSALGVVFGDIGTSPLYTLKTVLGMTGGAPEPSTVPRAPERFSIPLCPRIRLSDVDGDESPNRAVSWRADCALGMHRRAACKKTPGARPGASFPEKGP